MYKTTKAMILAWFADLWKRGIWSKPNPQCILWVLGPWEAISACKSTKSPPQKQKRREFKMNDYVVIITILFRWRSILNAVNLVLQVYKNYKIINVVNTKKHQQIWYICNKNRMKYLRLYNALLTSRTTLTFCS